MAEEQPTRQAIARIPLSDWISADELRALLDVVETYYGAYLWLEAAERGSDNGSGDGDVLHRTPDQALKIEFLTIGTPNEVQLMGPLAQITAIVALVTAMVSLPKLPLEREQLRVAIAKTEADQRLVELQALSAELDVIERANRLHAEGRISDSELAQQTERLKRLRPSLPYAAGIVRDTPRLDMPEDARAQRLQTRLLERAQLLGASDPAIALWLGVFRGDVAVVRAALDRGADPNVVYGRVIEALPPAVAQDEEFRRVMAELILVNLSRRGGTGAPPSPSPSPTP